MSRDGTWTRIVIGGDLRRSLMAELVQALEFDSVMDYEEDGFERAAGEGQPVEIEDDNGDGYFGAAEDFCAANGLTYYRWCAGDAQTAPYSEFWRPGMECTWGVYLHDDVVQVADLVRAFRAGKTLAEVIAGTVPPPHCQEVDVPPLRIIEDEANSEAA